MARSVMVDSQNRICVGLLYDFGIIDEIIPEPEGGAHNNYMETSSRIKEVLLKHLDVLSGYSTSELLDKRFEKLSKLGDWGEEL